MPSPPSPPDPATPDPEAVCALARTAARAELLPRFGRSAGVRKDDGSVVTAADLAMERRLAAELTRYWPQIPVLAEEMDPAAQRAALGTGGAVWIVDPLDGTSNFAAGVPFFCVSLALVRGGRVHTAVVYDPVRDEGFAAVEGRGAWCGGQPLDCAARPAPPLAEAVAGVDFKRLSADLAGRLVRAAPYRSQRNFGAAALDWCWVAAGRYAVYLHGGQQLWDHAAGSLILAEAGGRACTLEGEAVFRPALGPRSVVAAGTPRAFGEWCAWLGVTPLRD